MFYQSKQKIRHVHIKSDEQVLTEKEITLDIVCVSILQREEEEEEEGNVLPSENHKLSEIPAFLPTSLMFPVSTTLTGLSESLRIFLEARLEGSHL